MALTAAAFEGFNFNAAQRYLRFFDAKTRKKGEDYFRQGAVKSLECDEPGRCYSGEVLGGDLYEVTFSLDEDSGEWMGDCSCPMEYDCKHVFAAFQQLLQEYSGIFSQRPGSSKKTVPKPALSSSPQAPPPQPGTFANVVLKKLGRKLTNDEASYLKHVCQLYRQANDGQLHYIHQLAVLGIKKPAGWWDRLALYPSPPKTEAEFWNYVALYLTDQLHLPIPDFLEPVTDLAVVRDRMRRHQRGREVERWKQTLAHLSEPAPGGMPVTDATEPAELRLRFTEKKLVFEWRAAGSEWQEMKPGKIADFDTRYAPALSVEAALIWLPYWQRTQIHFSTAFTYEDAWTSGQIGRWLRQPLLRPMLTNEAGEPLVFHVAPLRWQVTQPEDDDGDYAFALVQADGSPPPKIWLITDIRPTIYLTPSGVFTGPPFDSHLSSSDHQTLIPAKAFESAGGLQLLNRLEVAPPPRLAARIRTVQLLPGIRAEIKVPWTGNMTEYCCLEAYGASADGEHVEYWSGSSWAAKNGAPATSRKKDFIQFNRGALGALVLPILEAGFKWDAYLQHWQLRLTKKFADAFVTLLKALPPETRIDLRGELAAFQNAEVAGKIRLEASETEMDWFDLRVIVDVSDATLTPEEIKLLLDAKGGWVRLAKKGWRKLQFSLGAEENQELARLGLTPHGLTSEPQRLHAFQLADRAARKFLPAETCERIERRATELKARVTPDLPAAIQAEMRPYQREGFHFLAYLSENRFGGILADDMGLGKTLQTLAWLAWLRCRSGTGVSPVQLGISRPDPAQEKPDAQLDRQDACPASLPSLVVCPKSVADNWQAEAAKFFPSLKVRRWAASELKSISGMLGTADLHVVNYSQLRLAGEDLVRERFHAVILDEGQYIKNPTSQTAQIARRLRTEHRLVLSGTPIENRLLDLWSLMSFAMPGALGSRAEFGRLYDAKGDPFARQRLAARVRPFLIRRTKAQVARDLPDRMEEDLFCELEGEQKTLYRAELKRAQAMLLGVKTAAALNKQRFNFLTSLLRLRQICCHPRLVKPGSKAPSAKVEALIETLEPLMEEGQKVLVFSQFVDLLDILRGEVNARNWPHWYLAGDTENRGDLVKQFQAGEGAGVFLISLKAGGFGLNLTAASYVVLFDPWWNPAVENQAIDRTHRIGQTQKVMAYRLLIKDSIEEKIRALQKQKSALASDVLGEEKFSQSLSLDDLRYLLAE